MNRAIVCLSTDEDIRRREYILNVILSISLTALVLLGLTIIWNNIKFGSDYNGMNPILFTIIILAYAGLLYLSKKSWIYSASFLLVTLNAIGTIYTGWKWGASLPETLLLTVLVIEIASILIGSTFGLITAGVMILALTILGIHESVYLNVPDWRYDQISVTDVITYSIMFLFISFIAWLANREIDKSLNRARQSEKLLSTERDTLEQKVSERTKELIKTQRKAFAKVGHSIQVGELARGVMHDMMSPLSAISLYIDELNSDNCDTETKQILIEKAMQASSRMNEFMDSVRHHIDPRNIHKDAKTKLKKEFDIVRDILAYKARMHNARISISPCEEIIINCCPLRIHQILINLVSNAIEAGSRNIILSASYANDMSDCLNKHHSNNDHLCVQITVTDDGCGMSSQQLNTLFTEPKSTKSHGTGIGLMTTNSIVTKELGGLINVESKQNSGTKFTITLPLINHGESDSINKE